MDRHGYFTVKDVVDYVFCPRSVYFHYCIKAGKESTPKMDKGVELHESFSDKSKRSKIVRDLPRLPRMYGVRLYSVRYNLNARIDCILFSDGEAYPVEFKASPRPKALYDTHRYQVVTQALIIEEVLKKKVPIAFIKYIDGSVSVLSITPWLRRKVTRAIKQMEEIVGFERIPRATRSKKRCLNCFYKNICRRL